MKNLNSMIYAMNVRCVHVVLNKVAKLDIFSTLRMKIFFSFRIKICNGNIHEYRKETYIRALDYSERINKNLIMVHMLLKTNLTLGDNFIL